jgi:hypothetical protein
VHSVDFGESAILCWFGCCYLVFSICWALRLKGPFLNMSCDHASGAVPARNVKKKLSGGGGGSGCGVGVCVCVCGGGGGGWSVLCVVVCYSGQ